MSHIFNEYHEKDKKKFQKILTFFCALKITFDRKKSCTKIPFNLNLNKLKYLHANTDKKDQKQTQTSMAK